MLNKNTRYINLHFFPPPHTKKKTWPSKCGPKMKLSQPHPPPFQPKKTAARTNVTCLQEPPSEHPNYEAVNATLHARFALTTWSLALRHGRDVEGWRARRWAPPFIVVVENFSGRFFNKKDGVAVERWILNHICLSKVVGQNKFNNHLF